jgi:hypothetical protein
VGADRQWAPRTNSGLLRAIRRSKVRRDDQQIFFCIVTAISVLASD